MKEINKKDNATKTPLNADKVFDQMPETPAIPSSMEESPVLMLVLFQKALRCELDRLHTDALAFVADGRCDGFRLFSQRWRFIFSVYRHHCDAEDEVILPALDIRVKNVARAYSLEHHEERTLFSQLFELLNSGVKNDDSFRRKVASCTGAIRTSLSQHMSKEEKQVFPLLAEKFTYEEQTDLVWHFFCSIPVNMIGEFLPWLSSCISPHEHLDLMKCLCKIVPEHDLLQQVISSWMEGIRTENAVQAFEDNSQFQDCLSCEPETYQDQTDKKVWTCQHYRNGKRKNLEAMFLAVGSTEMYPIDEILHWHNAIKRELLEILEVAKKIQHTGDSSELSTLHIRLQFIADIYNSHSIAEDQIIFPALEEGSSFVQEHSEEENQFNNFRQLIKKIHNTVANKDSPEFLSALFSQADQIMDSIHRHFQKEEAEVLPIARLRLCPEKQRELLYKSICVMPLKLLERVIPWFVATLTKQDARYFLHNIQMAASTSDAGLVTLLSDWALNVHSKDMSSSGSFICLSLKAIDGCPLKERNGIQEDHSKALCPPNQNSSDAESSHPRKKNDKRPSKRCNFLGSCENVNQMISFLPPLKYLHSISYSSSAPSLDMSLPYEEANIISSIVEDTVRPIDTIFKFHKAICKDLEYLDVESGKMLSFDEASLRHFTGRFHLLWSLYKAHSTAEDDIVFPALESREALHNVSHSYTLDHNQEERLFKEISADLEELSQLQANFNKTNAESDSNCKRKYNELATKLQSMCKSIRVSLVQHVYREELELWPLFDKHFTVEEQNSIVGRIIGTTGAEVLQSMLPWVTSALTEVEQNYMMGTWKQATRNTMFNEWLNEWWNGPSARVEPEINAVLTQGTENKESLYQEDQMFKPGWKDIFRMNQNELESEIRKVSRDPTLDSRRKAYLIQNLMTSRWIASQQKSPQLSEKEHVNSEDILGLSPSYRDPDKQAFGCEHYKRNCKLRAACCNKLFTCRFCHDKVSDHSMDRKATTQMLCMRCLTVQPVGQTCKTPSCDGFSMAKYFCPICKLFDDERTIYHCPFCNLCRVGKGLGIDYFHCMGCNYCLGMKLVTHKCRERSIETNCPICCDFMFTSTEPLRALRCGHFMHSACFRAYTCSHYICPLCSKSMGDMTIYFGMLDALLAAEELPEEYKGKCQDILCNDCDKKGQSPFHWLHHKCGSCGSYNTRVIKREAKGTP